MGLDMYIYRALRTHFDENAVISKKELETVDFRCPVSEVWNGTSQLLHCCQTIRVECERCDLEKIKRKYGFQKSPIMVSENNCGVKFVDGEEDYTNWHFGYDDGENDKIKSICIPHYAMESDFIIKEIHKYYVCGLEEIHYWRKEYDVQEWFHDNLSCRVENCGYYLLNNDLIEAHDEHFPEDPIDYISTASRPLFYHEWY